MAMCSYPSICRVIKNKNLKNDDLSTRFCSCAKSSVPSVDLIYGAKSSVLISAVKSTQRSNENNVRENSVQPYKKKFEFFPFSPVVPISVHHGTSDIGR